MHQTYNYLISVEIVKNNHNYIYLHHGMRREELSMQIRPKEANNIQVEQILKVDQTFQLKSRSQKI